MSVAALCAAQWRVEINTRKELLKLPSKIFILALQENLTAREGLSVERFAGAERRITI